MFPRPEFFQGARLNFAHNLLYPTFPSSNFQLNENDPAIIYATESGHKSMSWKELRSEVEKCTKALSQIVKPNDVIAGFLGNHAWTVVAMLASTYLGAIWTAVSPDTGVAAVLDRLVQIEPKVLFADDGVEYNGKIHSSMTKLKEITKALPNLQSVVVFENVPGVDPALDADNLPKGCVEYTYSKFIEASVSPFNFQLRSDQVCCLNQCLRLFRTSMRFLDASH
jgi:acetoacetyl-CoA synthetase